MITAVLKHAWDLYRTHFGTVAAVVMVIWLPLELLSSYMDYFVFDSDDFRRSFKFAQFLDNFFGIIATAGVISIGYTSWLGRRPSVREALDVGVRSWGRMWWTRFLTALTLVFGFLLLIFPGIYLLVRLALVEPIAVCERVSGSAAMRRSFELTRGHFWQVFLLGLVFLGLILAAIALVVVPVMFIPALDHWLIDAAMSLVTDVIAAFATLCALSAYVWFAGQKNMAEGAGPMSSPSTPPGSSAVTEEPPLVN